MNPEPSESGQARVGPTREQFFRWLFALVNPERPDRGTLAALRRGAGEPPGTIPAMHPLIETRVWDGDDANADAMYRVASLFAYHHQAALGAKDWPPAKEGQIYNRSLGASLGIAARTAEGTLDHGMERRFIALLETRDEHLDSPLRQLFSLIKARNRDTPVDWRQLYDDLRYWGRPGDRQIQRRWAAGFWRGAATTETPLSANEPAPSTEPAATGDHDDQD